MPALPTYVIVTPARNEAAFIELTLQSVLRQTVLPLKWVIVSDGSTDATAAIVARYAAQYPWIELVEQPPRAERHFAGKVRAFEAGYARIQALPFQVLISLDADLSFEPALFSFLLEKLALDSTLGLVGVPFRELDGQLYDYRYTSTDHVSGACQVFRRECFEAIGGYTPIRGGGIDLVAVVTARMKGWRTRTFLEHTCLHHRPMNSAMNSGLALKYRWGQSDYRLGGHPLWEVFRCLFQMRRQPYLVGGAATLAGYFTAMLGRQPRAVSPDFARFRGREQMERLRTLLRRGVAPPSPAGERIAAG